MLITSTQAAISKLSITHSTNTIQVKVAIRGRP